MSNFTVAMELYRTGRRVVHATAELAEEWFQFRIDREDLEEALLDLKVAVIDRDPARVRHYSAEIKGLIAEIVHKLNDRP